MGHPEDELCRATTVSSKLEEDTPCSEGPNGACFCSLQLLPPKGTTNWSVTVSQASCGPLKNRLMVGELLKGSDYATPQTTPPHSAPISCYPTTANHLIYLQIRSRKKFQHCCTVEDTVNSPEKVLAGRQLHFPPFASPALLHRPTRLSLPLRAVHFWANLCHATTLFVARKNAWEGRSHL